MEPLLYNYHPKFVKACKKQTKRLDIRQFLVPLQDWVSKMKHIWSNDRLLKNANSLKSRIGKNLTTFLNSETTKSKNFFQLKRP